MAVFSTTILTTWVALIFLLVVIYSKWRQKIYFSRMHTIYENYLHLYTEPDKESGGYKHYDVELKDGKTRLNNLVQGISMLNSLVKEIRTDYRNGTLMIMDMRFLFDRLYGIIEIFHRHVAQHMFLLINLYKSNSEDTDELLVLLNQHYVTSYVTQNDYDWLKELLEPKPESDGDKEDKNGS